MVLTEEIPPLVNSYMAVGASIASCWHFFGQLLALFWPVLAGFWPVNWQLAWANHRWDPPVAGKRKRQLPVWPVATGSFLPLSRRQYWPVLAVFCPFLVASIGQYWQVFCQFPVAINGFIQVIRRAAFQRD